MPCGAERDGLCLKDDAGSNPATGESTQHTRVEGNKMKNTQERERNELYK